MPQNRRSSRQRSQRRPADRRAHPRPSQATQPSRPLAGAALRAPGFRGRLEAFSYPALVKLTAMPKWALGVLIGALVLGGLLAPAPWNAVGLSLLVLFTGWLLVLAWPKLDASGRAMRGLIVVALIGLVVFQLTR